ncbi:MAG: disaggregatase related repeat-containing protein [Methanomethylovorans sp.]|uniref:disaggregatase related repeat-containing protein n=1 Tax=Methanomethylovorans sp. TaxID=2758717 RepID=UPI003C75063F
MTMGISSADPLDIELFSHFGGIVNDVVVSGNYAYVAQESDLVIYDVTNISDPLEIGRASTICEIFDIAITNNHAYLANSENGLMIIDITDPLSPVLVGSCDTSGYANSVAISGNYAYVADGNSGLVIIDITNSSAPTVTGTYFDDPAFVVAVSGNYAYVSDAWNGISIVNIIDPAAPTLAGDFDTNGSFVQDIAVSGNYAYLANAFDGLLIVDISDPGKPTLINKYDETYCTYSVTLYGDHAYVSGGTYIDILDVTDPYSPKLLGRCETEGYVKSISVAGDHAYMAAGESGFYIAHISDPEVPQIIGNYGFPCVVHNIAVTDEYAYIADGINGVEIFDPSRKLIGRYNDHGYVSNVTVSGNYAYLTWSIDGGTHYSFLKIVDVSDPRAPTLTGYYGGISPLVFAVEGNYAYVQGLEDYLEVVDVSDPAEPKLVASYDHDYVAAHGFPVYPFENVSGVDQNTIISYSATHDNRLRESNPRTVLSTTAYVDIGKSTTRNRGVMLFDLSDHKTTDTIVKATLSLNWYYPSGKTRASDTVIEIYRPAKWDPDHVTWRSSASDASWNTPGGDWFDKNGVLQGTTPYASVTFPADMVPDDQYHEFDVTQLVQEYVSGQYENTGFFLKAKEENANYIAFYSSDWPNTDQGPKLTVVINDTSSPSVPPVTDTPPVAYAGADQTTATDTDVTFDGSGSTDDKGIISYSWSFGDGTTAETAVPQANHTYATAGTYTVTLTVTDTIGQTDADTLQVVVSGPTTIITHTPDYDNRLRQLSPNTVYPSSNFIDVGRLGTASYRNVMWFDLSGYDPADTISQATLSLYWYYPAGVTRASDTVVEVYRPEKWDPRYATWNSRMSATSWNTPGGDWFDKNGVAQGTTPYASVMFPAGMVPDDQYHEFDVTQLVQEYVSGQYESTGFFLKARTEDNNYIAFYSSDWKNADQRPKMTVISRR